MGKTIQMVETQFDGIGIDVPEDLERAKKFFRPYDKRFARHRPLQFFRFFNLLYLLLAEVIWLLLVCVQSQKKEWEFLVARVLFE